MKKFFRSRTWHYWVGVAVVLPLLLVAATALLFAHKKALGTPAIAVAADWLPGYREVGAPRPPEVRAMLATRDGGAYLATASGLYRVADGKAVAVEALAGNPVRALAEAPWGRIAATRNGIWLEQEGRWLAVRRGEAWSVASLPDGSVRVGMKDQVLASRDGRRWQPDPDFAAALPVGREPITLARLALDLHTGRALVGRELEWLWIDLVSVPLLLLVVTGLILWWQRQLGRKKSLARQRRGMPVVSTLDRV